MFDKFVREIEVLTERRKTMGIEEFLLDRAEKQGIQKGITEKELDFTRNLLESTDFDASKIAKLVGVSEDFVLKIKKEIGK